MSKNPYVTPPSKAAVRWQQFVNFVETRRGWKYTNDFDFDFAGRGERLITYPDGSQVLLRAEITRMGFEGHIILAFSAGPEVSTSAKEMAGLIEWINKQEKLLTIPLDIAAADTAYQALEAANKIIRNNSYILECVFDVPNTWSLYRARHRIIDRCASNRVRKEVEKLRVAVTS